MSDELTIDNQIFISSKRASELSGYEQDYIGQLCRGGNIKARRVGGLWYVSADSLIKYKEGAKEYKPEPPIAPNEISKPDSLLSFDGRGYISTGRAAKMTGYSPDYVGQMARAGTIPSRQVGNRWYVEQAGILKHKASKDSLLAAVQSESVGLKTPIKTVAAKAASDPIPSPLYQYTSDNRDLIPSAGEPAGLVAWPEPAGLVARPADIGSISHEHVAITEEEPHKEEAEEENYVIPIRVYHGMEREPRGAVRNTPVLVRPTRTMLPMVLTAGVLTIVIVLSLGFVSLKNSSIYTNNATKDGITMAQLASAGMALADRVADILEPFVASELIYQRPQ